MGRSFRLALRAVGAIGAAGPASFQLLPSTLVLGQWWPSWLPDPGGVPGVAHWSGGASAANVVGLTFDDGPDPVNTPAMLAELDRLGVTATFFCLGQQAEAHPGLVKEIVSRGHEVGVHGHAHARHLARSPRWLTEDLRRAVGATAAAGVGEVRYFRAPYGQVSGGSLVAGRRVGLGLVLWSAWGREWTDGDPASVARRVGHRLAPGRIVLLHDSDVSAPDGTAARARAALPLVMETIQEKGLRPVRLSELLAR